MASTPADMQMLAQMMRHMDVEPEELLAALRPQNLPTFEQFVPLVVEATSLATRPHVEGYLNRVVACWGTLRLDEPTRREVGDLIEHFRATALRRGNHADGSGAAKHAYAALACLYRFAVLEGVLSSRQNPMARVSKPRQGKSRRYALSPALVEQIHQTAVRTGLDPRLDSLLLRLHMETAARPHGVRGLRLKDLDPDRQLITLREKGMQRLQPVSRTLVHALLTHAQERGATDGESRLLRLRSGRPITVSRYKNLWERLRQHIEVVEKEHISMYWVRHTTLTWVERNFGIAVARAYAGHAENNLWVGVTDRYVKAGLDEVATALQALTGEPHPLALPELPTAQSNEVLPGAANTVRALALSRVVTKII